MFSLSLCRHNNAAVVWLQDVEEKLQEKEASEWCRNMGVVEFLVRASDAATNSWACMDHPKSVADVFEALVGAVFMDSGEDFVCAFNVRSSPCYDRSFCGSQKLHETRT